MVTVNSPPRPPRPSLKSPTRSLTNSGTRQSLGDALLDSGEGQIPGNIQIPEEEEERNYEWGNLPTDPDQWHNDFDLTTSGMSTSKLNKDLVRLWTPKTPTRDELKRGPAKKNFEALADLHQTLCDQATLRAKSPDSNGMRSRSPTPSVGLRSPPNSAPATLPRPPSRAQLKPLTFGLSNGTTIENLRQSYDYRIAVEKVTNNPEGTERHRKIEKKIGLMRSSQFEGPKAESLLKQMNSLFSRTKAMTAEELQRASKERRGETVSAPAGDQGKKKRMSKAYSLDKESSDTYFNRK